MKIAITGTRGVQIHQIDGVRETLEKTIKANKPHTMYFGGAVGIDTIALVLSASILLDMFNAGCTEARDTDLIVIFPDEVKDSSGHNVVEAKKFASKVIGLNNEITRKDGWKSYKLRNQYLVDNSDLLIGFPKTERKYENITTGLGSWGTLAYAKEQKKQTIIHEID
jgi:hypothetical protein